MSIPARVLRPFRLSAVLIFALGAVACGDDDDPTEPDEEPATATIRLQIGTQTVNMATSNGAVTGGPVTIPRAATTISATFLRADGSADPVVQEATFRLDVTPSTGNVTFTRTGAFAGTLTGTAAGAATVQIALFHTGEGHKEYGDFPLAITVQ